jgi:Transposase DDE domain
VLNLVTSTNREGYSFALQSAWSSLGKNLYQTPVKSSLSEARDKVSYTFFSDIFSEDLSRFKRGKKTHRGYCINAVDGSDLDLPASEDVLSAGYRGSAWSKEYETYYPKMYVVHAYDVINGTVSVFKQSAINSERALTRELAFGFGRKSLTIYDRLFCGHPTFKSHMEAGNLFLVRAAATGKRLPLCIRDFLASKKVDQVVKWKPQKLRDDEALDIRLVKIRHPKTKEIEVFATNAPQALFCRLELVQLYLKRWEIESSFKDLVSTLKMDQWHSTKINGILQEIYCLLWIANAVKMQMNNVNVDQEVLAVDYSKSNFKMCVRLVVENFHLLFKNKRREFFELLDYWIRKTREYRRHRSRTYPRVVRSYGTGFNVDNKVLRTSRNN